MTLEESDTILADLLAAKHRAISIHGTDTGSSPSYGASPAANHPSATGSDNCATSSESCAAFGSSNRGLRPSPCTSLSTDPGVQWMGVPFSAFLPSIYLATGTPLAPSSAASQQPIASYMAFTPAPTTCTNVLPPYMPFIPSLTSTSVLSHTPPGSSAAPAAGRSCPAHLSFDVGPRHPPIPPKLVEQIQQGEFIDHADLLPDSLRDNKLPRSFCWTISTSLSPSGRRSGRYVISSHGWTVGWPTLWSSSPDIQTERWSALSARTSSSGLMGASHVPTCGCVMIATSGGKPPAHQSSWTGAPMTWRCCTSLHEQQRAPGPTSILHFCLFVAPSVQWWRGPGLAVGFRDLSLME